MFIPESSNIPQDVQRQFAKPGAVQKEFLTYLQKAGYEINQDKTIAHVAYSCIQVAAGGETRLEFFNQRVNGFTRFQQNTPDERPESEHAVVYAIQILSGNAVRYPGLNLNATQAQNLVLLTANINNVTKLDGVDVSNLISDNGVAPATYAQAFANSGVIVLQEPLIWGGQESAIFTLEFGNALVADDTIQVALYGMGLV